MEFHLKNNDLTILLNRREDIKREINNFNIFFDNLVKRHPKLVGIVEIKARLISIQQYWSMYEEIQKEIEENDKAHSDLDIHKKDRDNFEHVYYETIANSVLYLEQFIAKNPTLTQDHTCMSDIQLPGISLSKFSGDSAGWLSFCNLFKTLVHFNNDLDEFKKLCYLKICLSGNAALTITDHKINDYKVAWKLLEEQCNKDFIILRNHAKTLYELPKIEKLSTEAVNKLWDTAKLYIEKLESLQKNTYNVDSLLVPLIVSKFDQITTKEWNEKIANNSMPTIKDIEEFLKEFSNKLKNMPSNCLELYGNNLNDSINQEDSEISCTLCHKGHFLAECMQFLQLPPKQRYNCVKSMSLCTNCLLPGHISKFCPKRYNCKICHKNHHTLLHFFETNIRTENNPPIVRMYWIQQCNFVEKQMFTMQLIPRPMHAVTYTNMYFCGNFVNIFLATARVYVTDSFGHIHYCRVFLNCSSHANYITESLAKNMFINRGCTFTGTQQTIRISASSINSYYKDDLNVLVVPEITNITVPALHIDPMKLNIPQYIKMADPYYYQPSGFDILIGAEKFYDLLLPPKLQLKDDIELQDTMLGWIITGRIPDDAVMKF